MFLNSQHFLYAMVMRVGGVRRKTRHLMMKHHREKGKISLAKYFAEFNNGDKVVLKAEPAVQKGMYHLRYYGKMATVTGKRGECYEVQITDGNVLKTLIVHPIHLQIHQQVKQ